MLALGSFAAVDLPVIVAVMAPSNSSGVNGRGCRAAPDRAAWEPRHPIHTVVLSSCKARRIGSAAARCSNQADLYLTFTGPIWPSDLPQRPSLTSMPLATDQMLLSVAESIPSWSRLRRVLEIRCSRVGLAARVGTRHIRVRAAAGETMDDFRCTC